jgi:hypothetical protein
MMPTIYDIARDLKTAGVEVSAHINPANLTTRMRNSVKRMLLTGIMKGGYSSHAARITKMLTKEHNLSYVKDRYGYIEFRIHRAFNDQEREQLAEWFSADKMLTMLKKEDGDKYHSEWVNRSYESNMKTLNNKRTLEFNDMVRVTNKELNEQTKELISLIKTDEEIKFRKQLCAKFDNNELIPIKVAI